jgi:very-short-patch-repair endonuclease
MAGKISTKQAKQLFEALIERGISAEIEYWDGHKHIDIAIPDAHIYIEVDGLNHLTDPKKIIQDFKRDHFSDGDDFHTLHIPNNIVEKHIDEIADAIARVVALEK